MHMTVNFQIFKTFNDLIVLSPDSDAQYFLVFPFVIQQNNKNNNLGGPTYDSPLLAIIVLLPYIDPITQYMRTPHKYFLVF
jgi:hypothetical protein